MSVEKSELSSLRHEVKNISDKLDRVRDKLLSKLNDLDADVFEVSEGLTLLRRKVAELSGPESPES